MEDQTPYQKVASHEAVKGQVKKCVLLYSGGLDTSIMLKWLQDSYNVEVVALCIDIGQQADDLEEIKAKALELGADIAGCCALTPIMIDDGFDMPHCNVVSFIVKEDYANVLKGSRAIEAETYDVYVRVAEISTELAAFIRDLGYPAWAHHNGIRQIQVIRTSAACTNLI